MEKNSKNCGFEIKLQPFISLIFSVLFLFACGKQGEAVEVNKPTEDFKVRVDRFADLEILRYQVPQFEDLSLRQKKFVYFLSQAALSGRDILYDQNYKSVGHCAICRIHEPSLQSGDGWKRKYHRYCYHLPGGLC